MRALVPIETKKHRWVSRVLARMVPEPGSECIRWIGSINPVNGYGQYRIPKYYDGGNGNPTGAHRVIYLLIRGPIPSGHHLDHRCSELGGSETDNRWCVNAYHLEPVLQEENARLANRRRWYGDRGEPSDDGGSAGDLIL